MMSMEQQMKLQIIPEEGRNPKNIRLFNMNEIYEDLKTNAKYRNRNSAAIQRSIDKIKAVQNIRN
jgi:hypothetical protein